jgi:GTPase SAR1 family protein
LSHHQCLFEFVELDGLDGLYGGGDACPKGFEGLDSLILVYDVGDRMTFTALPEIHKKALELSGKADLPVAVMANKFDMFQESREVSEEEGLEFAEAIGGLFGQCSAREGDGIKELIQQLMRQVVNERVRLLDEQDMQLQREKEREKSQKEQEHKESRRMRMKRSMSGKIMNRLSIGSG